MYLDFESKPKPTTTSQDIGRGQVDLRHLAPALFLELQLIKLHNHKGSTSVKLEAEATPEVIRGYVPNQREEHGTATWSGGAASSGSVALTFGTAFKAAPTVFAIIREGNANYLVGISTPSVTGVTLYWRDADANTHTSVSISWIAIAT